MIAMMKAAAKQADLQNVKLISEPEAAAMFIHYSRKATGGPLGKPLTTSSQPYLLLDVSGGTAVSLLNRSH